ncbi:MmgE/PrpD family protein [soil metagenome]
MKSVDMSGQLSDAEGASLSRRLIRRNQQPVASQDRARAVLHWLDWIGCVAAGARAPVAGVIRAWEPQATPTTAFPSLLGLARDPFHAVLMDAGPANVEEMDDMHRQAILHPGPVILPALAGLARSRPLSAWQVLDATVRGYETMIRIGRAVGPRHYYFWHNTATAGTFGAAAACADALQLTEDASVWALGNAGTQAAGLWQVRLEPVMSKQLHTAHAAWAGLTAASLAQAGFTGPAQILEGPRGFFAAMCADGDMDALTRADADWLIHSTSFKPWPACRHTHATIDCVLALREAHGNAPLPFDQAEVEAFADAIAICDNPQPRTRTEAKFSLQYVVAAAATFGPLRPEHFDEACFTRPDLVAAIAKVALRPSTALTQAYPAHYGARVTLKMAGPSASAPSSHEVRDSLGDPERPLSTEAVFDKARTLMQYGGVGTARAQDVLDAAAELLAATADATAAGEASMSKPLPAALLAPLFV